jgi:hypothetical protein
MGTSQRGNIDLQSIKTVFHGSQQLKMKMEIFKANQAV